jgi:hypothetical protein
MTRPPDDLIAHAKAFAKAKAAILDAMPHSVAVTCTCWLAEMQEAAAQGDSVLVHSLASRIDIRLRDERNHQLHEQRRDRDQRGQHFRG